MATSADKSLAAKALAAAIAAEIGCRAEQAEAAIALLDGGATVPFVARYRKEATGGLDDAQLRTLAQRLVYLRELGERRAAILRSIGEQGKLTPALEAAIASAATKVELEDLYLPYKPKRRTRAEIARENGLAPLAENILADRGCDPERLAAGYLGEKVPDVKAALDGARDILAERFAEDAALVGKLRARARGAARLRATVVAGKEAEGEKFANYFAHEEPWSKAPGHRVLAMLRGRNDGVLDVEIVLEEEEAGPLGENERAVAAANGIDPNGGTANRWLMSVVRWAWKVKLAPHLVTDLLVEMRERAEAEAISVFARNLKDLLLAAPAGSRPTMGLDPGIRTGVKVAVVDATGRLVDTATVYPFQPRNDVEAAVRTLQSMIRKHGVELVAIGNGTASRETDRLAAAAIAGLDGARPTSVVVSEAGASVYSASEIASAELPDVDVSLRGAASIARRLQDPLAELVKIEPKAIGVGQYQHDVDQHALSRSLDAVVEDAVNAVGVDLNTASAALLSRVSGVGQSLAEAIVAHRDREGAFRSRKALLKVPRLGPKAFEQCAGFLRIRDGDEPLDASSVHPEAYPVAKRIVAACGRDLRALMGDREALSKVDAARFVGDGFGLPTIRDILAELEKPGRDPRPAFRTASFAEGVNEIADLKPGMMLEGTVTNVANFGAFVDVGVHQDGLVHVSELADRFVRDPAEVVKAGDVVRVRVLDVDVKRKRIALSMRKERAGEGEASRGRPGGEGRGPAVAGAAKGGASGRDAPGKAADGGKPAAPGRPKPEPQGSLGAALAEAMKRK